MKQIIFIQDINDKLCKNKIEETLIGLSIPFTIDLDKKIVVIEGNNDDLALVKRSIQQLGYTIV